MARKRKNNFAISEAVRIAVTSALQRFYHSEDKREYEFPSSFTAEERAFIHNYCLKIGLKSKSRGKGSDRFLTAYKKAGSTIVQADASFSMGSLSCQYAVALLQKFPLNIGERRDLLPPTERERLIGPEVRDVDRRTVRLSSGIPQVPPRCEASPFEAQRRQLPIWQCRESLVATIARNQVTIVVGETGCGKTTQVPQFLLEHHANTGQIIRIVCTEPRRLAAIAVAERICAERNERMGITVGYQIRLENKVSPRTLLNVCTNGILLRTLMGDDSSVSTITHVIVDEVHERDRFSDFLLIVLRDLLPKFRNLKLIVMSATIDVDHFVKYFGGCPVVEVPSKSHNVKAYFLEDVLRLTNYLSSAMIKVQSGQPKTEAQRAQLAMWCERAQSQNGFCQQDFASAQKGLEAEEEEEVPQRMDSSLAAEMDWALHQAWMKGTDEAFSQLLYHFLSENVNVDHRHSETSATALMLAAGRGKTAVVGELLALGADPRTKASNGWTPVEWAQHFQQDSAMEMLLSHLLVLEGGISTPDSNQSEQELSDVDRERLELYQRSIDDDRTDLELVMALLRTLHGSSDEGAILVFLAGFDDMASLKQMIQAEHQSFSSKLNYFLCLLHSNVHSNEQRQVFNTMPPGTRKIVLSTNIAETSITIDDVSFVIDSGKVKEKSFDSLTGTTLLKSVWVSRASAVQRKGRAGRTRPGVCFHLFSRQRFLSLAPFQQPELLRLPLQELCLQAKLLAEPNVPIADFLARAPDPPPFMVSRAAVSLLKAIDALDPSEQLTEMGLHLLDLPIDPQLGKMVLYAIVLKCLDPVITIVCCLSVKDPFVLPTQPGQRRSAYMARRALAGGTYSDHMALLRAFQEWQLACFENVERYFCERHCVSGPTMATILATRGQLLSQLRATGFVQSRGCGDLRDLNKNSESWPVVKAALCAGSYPNLLRVDRERRQLVAQRASRVRFHSRSVLSQPEMQRAGDTGTATGATAIGSLPTDWLLYGELASAGPMAYAHMCTLVSPITVALFAGPLRLPLDALYEPQSGTNSALPEDSDSEQDEESELQKCVLKLDDWVSLKVAPEVGQLALQLRQKMQALFLRRMKFPLNSGSHADEAVVRAVVGVLMSEEDAVGLPKGPPGMGQRPKPHSLEPSYPSFSASMASPHDPGRRPDNSGRRSVLRKGVSLDYGTAAESLPTSRRGSGASLPATPFGAGAGSWCSDERSDTLSLPAASSGLPSPCLSPRRSPNVQRRFYIVKPNSQRIVDISVSVGLWSLAPAADRKVQWALKTGKEVVLMFSVQGSGHFQGYAQLMGLASSTSTAPNDSGAIMNGRCYIIEWKHRCNLPFQSTRHLQNPWNENRKVQISRDGQEIEPSVGEALCRLWLGLPDARLTTQIVRR